MGCCYAERSSNNNLQPTPDYMGQVKPSQVKVKVNVRSLDIARLRDDITSEALRYGTCSQGISQFTCTPTRSSAIGMIRNCLCLTSYSWYSFTDPEAMEG